MARDSGRCRSSSTSAPPSITGIIAWFAGFVLDFPGKPSSSLRAILCRPLGALRQRPGSLQQAVHGLPRGRRFRPCGTHRAAMLRELDEANSADRGLCTRAGAGGGRSTPTRAESLFPAASRYCSSSVTSGSSGRPFAPAAHDELGPTAPRGGNLAVPVTTVMPRFRDVVSTPMTGRQVRDPGA